MNFSYFSYFLLEIIPGLNNTIPGVDRTYLPEQGAAAAAKLFEKTYADAWIIFGLMVFISIAFSVISKYVDLGEEWNIIQALKRIGTIAVLLVGFKFIFGSVFIVNHALSVHIFGEDNVSELNKQFERIATNEQENKGVTGDADENPISRLFTMLGQITSDIIIDTLAAIIAFVFFISTTLMHMLWRVAVIILYVTGPILIALSLFPGFGAKILAGWFGATFQIACWQVWFAICAFFVQTSDNTDLLKFTVGNTKAATANHIESVVFALIFTILFIGTPLAVNLLVPISSFSSGLVGALKFGGFPVKAAVGAVAGAAGSVAGVAGKGLLGLAASKLFSREGGGGSANAGGAIAAGSKAGIDRGSSLKNIDSSGGNDGGGNGGGRTSSSSEGLQDRRARRFNTAKVKANSGTSANANRSTVGASKGTSGGGAIDRGTTLGANGLSSPIVTQIGSSVNRGSSNGNNGNNVRSDGGSIDNGSIGNRISNPASESSSTSPSVNGNRTTPNTSGSVDRSNSGSTSSPSSSNSSSSNASQTPLSIDRANNDNNVSSSGSSVANRTSESTNRSGAVNRNSNGSTPSPSSSSSSSSNASQTPSSINRGSNSASSDSVGNRTSNGGSESTSTNVSGSRSTPNAGGVVDRNNSSSTPSSSNSSSPIITQVGASINRGNTDRTSSGNNNINSNVGNKNNTPESRSSSPVVGDNRSTSNGDSVANRNSGLGSSSSSIPSSNSSSNPANATNNSASASSTNVASNRSVPNEAGRVNRNSGTSSSSSSSTPSSAPSKSSSSPIITQVGSSSSINGNGINRVSSGNSESSISSSRSTNPSSNRGNMRFVRLRNREDKPTDKG